jgi:hypothetical protein
VPPVASQRHPAEKLPAGEPRKLEPDVENEVGRIGIKQNQTGASSDFKLEKEWPGLIWLGTECSDEPNDGKR